MTGLFLVMLSTFVFSQGVTTSSLRGKVVDDQGLAVMAANVVAIHVPSGTQYGTTTNEDGRYNIRNMRVGGPYAIEVSFVGYQKSSESDVFLQLNKTGEIDFTISETAEQLDEVVLIYNKDDVINSDRTGAMTNISREQIDAMPSIARSQRDLTRITPESDGNSFGGRNNLYNNFSLDGSIFNNPFGLDYATPGGQSDAQPVSLDAIDQIQVSLAPFDVREGGFTGAGINAVTKSGTNEFYGTAYYYFRNEGMVGKKVGEVESPNTDFSTMQAGGSIGGPIIKNKLFFFVNFEAERREQLAHGFVADNGSNSGSNVTSVPDDSIQLVQARLRDYWNYEPGAYQGYNHLTSNNKLLVKLDWNINTKHKVTLRYNMLDAWKDILPHPEAIIGRGPTSYRLPFENSSYRIFNKIHSIVGEVNSMFSSNLSNNLLIAYTAFRDHREPHSEPWPVVDIFDQNGNLAITMGSEMFSTSNVLNQDVFQLTDNLTLYRGSHIFTAGLNFEMFLFDNSFNLFYYPWFTFGSVNDFLANDVNGIDFNQETADAQQNDYAWSYLDVAQLGLYLQDEWAVSDKVNLTFGLRVDIPMYFNEIEQNDAVLEARNFDGWVNEEGESAKVDPSAWPNANPLWSPRFGFNYDIKGDNTLQLRGGTGIFSGRIPFVWLGNQSSNSGIFPGYTFQVNATVEDYRWPQVWKSNLALDAKLGDGWLFTLEGIYGNDINAVVHRNYNMLPPSGQLTGTGDNRARFAGFNEVNIYSSSAEAIGFLDAGTILLDNTGEGSQFSLTGKVAKDFAFGLHAMVAYTYMDSKDYTSIPAEIAADAFQRNPVVGNPNMPMLSWSRYGLKHRIVSSLYYKKSYKFMATTLGLFIEAGKGDRYSYTYAGDLNGDAIGFNDLLYVPNSASDIHFGTVNAGGNGVAAADAAAQWAALDAFIEQDQYLSTRRGDYAERNGAMLPWYSQFDFRIAQDFTLETRGGKKNTLQISLDIMNIGNLFSSNWGERKFATTFNPISVNGVDNNGTPWLGFNTNLTDSYVDDVSVNSKWQMQVGIRYIFH
jgi:hypothetical protein